jgi:hypothetical protein
MDSIITEARFEPHIVAIVKQLVRAARKQRLVMLPVTEAVVMARLARSQQQGGLSAAAVKSARSQYLAELIARFSNPTAAAAAPAYASDGGSSLSHYGEVFEALLRCWKLLPIGIYRRVHPATGLKTPAATAAAVSAAGGLPSAEPGAFANNRALVSYVYTSPSPNTRLSEHDILYVLHTDDGDDDGMAAIEGDGLDVEDA